MKQYKTVNEVIRQGHLVVNLPIPLVAIITGSVIIGVGHHFFKDWNHPLLLLTIIPIILLPIGFGWLWWSFAITKWRIWAFRNTKKSDWLLLEQQAEISQLIHPKGSQYEKTEIRTKEEKEILHNINREIQQLEQKEQEKFEIEEVNILRKELIDDPTIPYQTDYFYKTIDLVRHIVLSLFLIILGAYFLLDNNIIYGVLGIILFFYVLDWEMVKYIWTKEAQISMNEEGIKIKKIKKFGLINWNDTQDITVDTIEGILEFNFWTIEEGKEKLYTTTFFLTDYVENYDEFLRICNVYLKRNSDNQPPTQ